MKRLKKNYLIVVVDPEDEEVAGIFLAPEDKFPPMNLIQPEEAEQEEDAGPDFYYPEDREHLHELRRKAMERERKKRFQERMLRWMM